MEVNEIDIELSCHTFEAIIFQFDKLNHESLLNWIICNTFGKLDELQPKMLYDMLKSKSFLNWSTSTIKEDGTPVIRMGLKSYMFHHRVDIDVKTIGRRQNNENMKVCIMIS